MIQILIMLMPFQVVINGWELINSYLRAGRSDRSGGAFVEQEIQQMQMGDEEGNDR
ncbi:hypothetical protein H6769_07150 [Candidatus Peribacteria bacterium]|nr:hypothetical protein [Candidatus Peribacteria bacterium]